MITITKDELCTILCALRESAASATQYGFMTPAHPPERAALLANADAFSGLANRLMQRESAQADRRYAVAADKAAWAEFTGLVCV